MKNQKLAFHLIILILFLVARVDASDQTIQTKTVTHIAIIWLKKTAASDSRDALINATKGGLKIPGVKSVQVGSAIQSERPVVDSSYDLGVSMEFESLQALRNYEQNPIHKKSDEDTLKPLASKFIIYDFVNE
ncbi:MAG: Dabb family protein [Verrucomicrobiota bacterium]|nr:Dabb family protein [Verrucomicrobiota bacterium]